MIRPLGAVLGVALGLLAVGCGSSSSPLPGWDVVGKGKDTANGATVNATGTLKQPTAFAIRVEAKPDVTTSLNYTLSCDGAQTLNEKTKVSTPITTTMLVPPGNPSSCTMHASARKPAAGKLTLTVFAQSTPPTA